MVPWSPRMQDQGPEEMARGGARREFSHQTSRLQRPISISSHVLQGKHSLSLFLTLGLFPSTCMLCTNKVAFKSCITVVFWREGVAEFPTKFLGQGQL